MGLIVQKFGGSSVRDRERLLRAMRIVRRTWEQGGDVVVVLSAQGDTTDALLARARELTEEPPPRELDALLATGETASVALGAIALASLGVPAVSLSGWQVPVGTDGTHGGANVRSVGAERIRQELAARGIDRDVAEEAAQSAAQDAFLAIGEILDRRYPCIQDEKTRRRAVNALLRLGYGYDDIRTVLRERLESFDEEGEGVSPWQLK